jgi:hypothetical protein
MKRKIAYSAVVFFIGFFYIFAGVITQLAMGVLKSDTMPELIGLAIFFGILLAVIFFFAAPKIASVFGIQFGNEAGYSPSRKFAVISAILIALTAVPSVMVSYSKGSGQLAAERQQKEAVENRKLVIKKAAEAEQQRLAALSPGKRAAEEQQKRDKATAEAKVAAAEAARKEVAQAKATADKKKRDAQLQLAGAGASALKRAAKDPETFELKSLFFMPSGAACYEYRAKNSFGAILPGSAVLTVSGKMLLKERDGNTFVNAWNKECTVNGGEEIAPFVKRLGVLS